MKKIIFITPEDAEYGFKLVGVTHHAVKKEELEKVIDRLVKDPDTGLVVVDERLLGGIDAQRLREIEKRWYGVLITIPAPEMPGIKAEDYAVALIRRAIGYHVRLRL